MKLSFDHSILQQISAKQTSLLSKKRVASEAGNLITTLFQENLGHQAHGILAICIRSYVDRRLWVEERQKRRIRGR